MGDPYRYRALSYMGGRVKPTRALVARLALAVGTTPELVELACQRARERRRARLEAMRAAEDALRR
jgi:hypothetical protein